MSDEISFAVIISEGIHDVMSIIKILSLKGFREITSYSAVPESLAKNMIPTKYPWAYDGDQLTWSIPHPSFLEREGQYIVVSNANGKDQLGANLFRLLGAARRDELRGIRSIAVVADADLIPVGERIQDICDQLTTHFAEQSEFAMDTFSTGEITVLGKSIPAFSYIFPDLKNTGTLEKLLLEGATASYPDLLSKAISYVDAAKDKYEKYLKNFDSDKAVVGVIANILKPGRPNQASIHDNKWFTTSSLVDLPLHQKFSEFIDQIIETLI